MCFRALGPLAASARGGRVIGYHQTTTKRHIKKHPTNTMLSKTQSITLKTFIQTELTSPVHNVKIVRPFYRKTESR